LKRSMPRQIFAEYDAKHKRVAADQLFPCNRHASNSSGTF
jgi:hypothetical protein